MEYMFLYSIVLYDIKYEWFKCIPVVFYNLSAMELPIETLQ